jgi:hypothetical protein
MIVLIFNHDIRDSGILHYLLGIADDRQLFESPQAGNSWEGYLIEQLISRMACDMARPPMLKQAGLQRVCE